MKSELWQNPYNWSQQDQEIKFSLIKFFEAAAQAKRLQIDPFEEVVKIRCTQRDCKERYSVQLKAFEDLASNTGFDSLKFLNPDHVHFLTELGFQDSGRMYCKQLGISSQLNICKMCWKSCPFPWQGYWQHNCGLANWGLAINKPNTLAWKGSAWVLMINYDHGLWNMFLNSWSHLISYDEIAAGWIVKNDNAAAQVELACTASPFLHGFKRLPKPKVNPNASARGMVSSQKALAAMQVLQAIPPEFLPKVKKAIQSALHPDRDPQNREALTKAFQNFEEAWRRYEGK